MPGLHLGVSGAIDYTDYIKVQKANIWEKGRVMFGGEEYSGWFTTWGKDWGGKSTSRFTKDLM